MAIAWLMQTEGRIIGNAGPLFFMLASRPATVEVLEEIESEIRRVANHHGPISFLMVIRPTRAERVTPEAKARLAKMLKDIAPICLGQAMVVDAKGLLGTIVRAFLTGLSFVTTGNGYPTKVMSNVPDALDWLATLPRQDGGYPMYRRDLDAYFIEQERKQRRSA